MSEETKIVINRNERANSYEIGTSGKRFKLYFEDIEDLKKQLAELKKEGLLE